MTRPLSTRCGKPLTKSLVDLSLFFKVSGTHDDLRDEWIADARARLARLALATVEACRTTGKSTFLKLRQLRRFLQARQAKVENETCSGHRVLHQGGQRAVLAIERVFRKVQELEVREAAERVGQMRNAI